MASSAGDEPLGIWRQRRLKRCNGELGTERSQAIVHAPATFELSKDCTVGCWFCGVAALKFDHIWPCTEENAAPWRDTFHRLPPHPRPAAPDHHGDDPVRLRSDLKVTVENGELRATALGQRMAVAQKDLDDLAECLPAGRRTGTGRQALPGDAGHAGPCGSRAVTADSVTEIPPPKGDPTCSRDWPASPWPSHSPEPLV
ncbi:hypothetical protein [Streptomyces orinoci]|uniref:Uncharacterized protein n=1 Tax=Streptomyces orinoci TaxID=67339 RepID=A0ABV3JZY1_STRON|nr:hypothetical protein [Streptomyces orinoci]